MTLPEFQYPHQNAAYLEALCRRWINEGIVKDPYKEGATYLPILNQTIPPAEQRSF